MARATYYVKFDHFPRCSLCWYCCTHMPCAKVPLARRIRVFCKRGDKETRERCYQEELCSPHSLTNYNSFHRDGENVPNVESVFILPLSCAGSRRGVNALPTIRLTRFILILFCSGRLSVNNNTSVQCVKEFYSYFGRWICQFIFSFIEDQRFPKL